MEIEEEYLVLDQGGFPQNLACELSFVSLFHEVFFSGGGGVWKRKRKDYKEFTMVICIIYKDFIAKILSRQNDSSCCLAE